MLIQDFCQLKKPFKGFLFVVITTSSVCCYLVVVGELVCLNDAVNYTGRG